jgi:hypothetical protein
MLILFALVVGVLGMHALVLLPARPDVDGPVAAPDAAVVAAVSGPGHAQRAGAAPGTPPRPTAPPLTMTVSDGAVGPHRSAEPDVMAAATVGQELGRLGHGAGHGPGDGSMPSSLHQVLHLCLAILSALLALGAIALALWRTVRPDRQATRISRLEGRAPPRRPPPTSVRLAQLCVLRN